MPKKTQPPKRLRVRSKSLAQIDETKLALAFWLMAKRQLEEAGDDEPSEQSAP